MDSKVNTYKKL